VGIGGRLHISLLIFFIMKSDFYALNKILSGKIVVPPRGDHIYITADLSDPSEFIFIPFDTAVFNFSILTNFEERMLIIPGEDDRPINIKCAVTDNNLFAENDFTWVGQKHNGCWAYYPAKSHISLIDILKICSEATGAGIERVLSGDRKADAVFSRYLAMFFIKKLYRTLSLGTIGKMTGGMDHATVIHGIRAVENVADPKYHGDFRINWLNAAKIKIEAKLGRTIKY